ncbi:hypothetical protein [Brucella sp. NBRC 12950]|uniref:hypothetical protein n=2 Tax=Brucella/Ochrobactrum group TaxID=2826938 RepID=UPI0024A06A65|nr:hypothetical protein [Brucella sp. NBRC 12950]GLU27561.1 hypothetical protein Brsp01_27940 [Brucella sp. NBRC 12950]
MESFTNTLTMSGILLICIMTQTALANQPDVRAALERTYVNAVACKKEFGSSWDPITEDARVNLTAYLDEIELAKFEQDVVLTELNTDAQSIPVTEELRQHCHRVMSSGG